MNVQSIRTEDGRDMVMLSAQDFEDLIDARDHAATMQAIGAGLTDTISDSELDTYFEAPTPLAFWRARRGVSVETLATSTGLAETTLASIESGEEVADVRVYARVAKALRVRIEDLLADAD